MRRTFFALALLASGCIAGSAAVQRDDRMLRELSRQERWAQQAIDARPTRDQLDSIRGSDYGSVAAARKEFQKLVMAVDRGTWIRETTAEMMREDHDPQLAQEFDRGGRLRIESIQAADELADALADAKGGLTVADLKPAFEALRKAQASEDRLSRLAGTMKLAMSPIPMPRPFVEAAAKVVDVNPESAKELDRLPPEDQTKIRAKMADLGRNREEQKRETITAASPSTIPSTSTEPPPREAEAPSTTLKIAGDAAAMIAKRPPRSITLREDGLFALSYDDADYLVDPEGKLVRKETPSDR
ncbi:MAG: hypothetical protein LC689_09000 [Myxococcales bacterium]|nr:hypothetical protein [Myxococcales bacterium]